MVLRTNYIDDEDSYFAADANATNTQINDHSIEIADLQTEVSEIPGVNDSLVSGFVSTEGSLTRIALDERYQLPGELETGPAPLGVVHANAGVGAVLEYGGTRTQVRATVTTGSSPEQGGILAAFTLTNYDLAPVVQLSAANAQSYMIGVMPDATNVLLYLIATSETEPFTAYTFNISIFGV